MPFRIGRANSHLSIATDRGLSREHAVIEWQPTGFTIMDLNSSNGTYLNGKRLHSGSPEPLPFGAIIRIGDSLVLTFSSDEIIELPDLTGSVIAGRYRLSRIIRNGFKSALYQATDTRLPQDVAVKLLSPSLVRFSGYVEQFDREANMAVRLSHPNIVKVIDYGETQIALAGGKLGTTKYLTMELMQGTSLAERLASKTLPTLEQILSWIDDVSNALEYAHAEGVIHSGLKLSSVLLDRQGRAYVTDFGMAYGQADNGKRIFFGSPEFLAPEQWDGSEAVSAKVDQYSLGVLTYLLLAGSYPFEGQRDPNVRDRNFITGPPAVHEEALRKSHRVLHGAVSLALSRALSVRPDERFPSVREFFSALKGAITNPSITGKLRIFVSYQRDPSSGWAAFFARELEEKHGISVYVDTQQVEGVGRFPVRLANAVKACDVFVCLLASTTLQSKWVQNEIKLAWESGRPMIPVFQESFTLPDGSDTLEPYIEALLNYDGVHLLDHRHIHVDHTIAEVARIVKQSRPQGTRPASH
jgi:serine/threonine protein kinase